MCSPKPSQRRTFWHHLICALLLVSGAAGLYQLTLLNAKSQPVLPPLAAQRHLQQWLDDNIDELMQAEPLYHQQQVANFYRAINYRTAWIKNYQLSDAGQQLLLQLLETSADELRNYHYHSTYLHQRLRTIPTLPREATALDILLTDAFMSYAEDVLSDRLLPDTIEGRPFERTPLLPDDDLNNELLESPPSNYPSHIKPVAYHPLAKTDASVANIDIVQLLIDNARSDQLGDVLRRMTPAHHNYQLLREAMIKQRQLVLEQRWKPLPPGPRRLEYGQHHPQIKQLREMLALYGDYRGPVIDSDLFDDELLEAVRHFQRRHGQEDDGIVGHKTRKLLNTSPAQRIKTLALNMKRWRQLPRDLGERYLWVNLNDYRLQLINHDSVELEMKVIVGKPQRQTPVLQASIATLVLNPSWNVPRRIATHDLLPRARKNPQYLVERNIEVFKDWSSNTPIPVEQIDWAHMSRRHFPYRLRQKPGQDNALGLVKFVIPNDLSIYLHDTNHRELFDKPQRAMSSGCVRVERPIELAKALLKEQGDWDDTRLANTLATGKTTYVKLAEPIPTYLMYWTVWVDSNGTLQFRDDIYQYDRAHFKTPADVDSLIL